MTAGSTTSNWGKSGRIAARLRARIVAGEWAPGERLPNRLTLEREFATSAATIQKALDALREDALVVTHGARGTFVSEQPPHRHRIGIVYPCDPANAERWHRIYAAIDEEARRLMHEGRYDLRSYYGTAEPQSAGREQLLADIAADRLAGIFVVAMSLAFFDGTTVLGHPYLRVAAMSSTQRPGTLPVVLERLLPAALSTLRELGRQRVALIYSRQAPHLPDELLEEAPRRGLISHPNWCVPAWPDTAQAARTGAYLLLRQPEAERPDAIVVADDYLAEQATLGVLDAGMRAPEDVTVLVQCNFPHLPPAVTPIVRLGVDLPDLLNRTVAGLLSPALPERVLAPILDETTWRAQSAPSPLAVPLTVH